MVAVLALGREFGHDRLRAAITATVSLGACDVAAVRYLLTEASLQRAPVAPIEVGDLARYDRPIEPGKCASSRPPIWSLPWKRRSGRGA